MSIQRILNWFGKLACLCLLVNIVSAPLLASEIKDNKPDKIYTVAFAQDSMSNDWRAAQVQDVEKALSKYPFIKFIYTDAKGNSARQALDIERLVNEGADVIITSPRDADIMTPVISRIYKNGTPVVLLTRRISSSDYTTFIGADDYEIGRQAAKYLAERLNNKGRVIMLKGVATASTSIKRTQGFNDQIRNYPEIKVVAEAHADYRRNRAIIAMEKILSDGVEFDALYAQSDSMATGSRMVMKKSGIDPASKIIVGIDYIEEARQAILNDEQDASFTYPTAGMEGAEAAVNIIRGNRLEKERNINFELITKEKIKHNAGSRK